jgi:anthranilate phosphoribosyltransferase
VETESSVTFVRILTALFERQPLSSMQVTTAMEGMLLGDWGEPESAAFLVGMRMKGETAEELAAAARVLRQRMVKLECPPDGVLDTCGTGGDDHSTFNISTAVALVVAAAGVPVVKHGNRAVSSRSGSADVLSELGVPIESGPAWAAKCLQRYGLAFCFAPQFHPVLKSLGPLRRRLGVRTMMNLLGPLANPAEAPFQILGVGHQTLLDSVAGALALLGTQGACVVCSDEGLDEVSLSAPTHYRRVTPAGIISGMWTSADFGLPACQLYDLRAADVPSSAATIRAVLQGQRGPCRDVVLANAAVALWVAQRASDLRSGVQQAAQAIDSGQAHRLLELLQSSA